MKNNPTTAIFGFIFLGSLGVGTISGYLAYQLGSQSLEGVKSPQENPTKNIAAKDKVSSQNARGFTIIPEEKILVKVYDYTHAYNQNKKSQKSKAKPSDEEKSDSKSSNSSPSPARELNLPLRVRDGGVTMEITKITQEQNSLSLAVNLTNNGSENVRFLYSFLNIKDERDRIINGIAENLPENLPPNGEQFSGQIRIPLPLLDSSERLAIELSDYPEQTLELNIPEIPILR